MKRYVALLRGINISGKNKISMPDLKRNFEELGFVDTVTYLNSGNIIFSSTTDESEVLLNKIRLIIKDRFALDIPVLIIMQEELEELLNNAPDWWGDDNKEIYDNLIFIMPPISYEAFYDEIGNPKAEHEKVHHYKNVVFWSFSRKDYQKTNWWSKTANAKVSNQITIRTANTVRKIAAM